MEYHIRALLQCTIVHYCITTRRGPQARHTAQHLHTTAVHQSEAGEHNFACLRGQQELSVHTQFPGCFSSHPYTEDTAITPFSSSRLLQQRWLTDRAIGSMPTRRSNNLCAPRFRRVREPLLLCGITRGITQPRPGQLGQMCSRFADIRSPTSSPETSKSGLTS